MHVSDFIDKNMNTLHPDIQTSYTGILLYIYRAACVPIVMQRL